MPEEIDFSGAVQLTPRKDSWEKVVARIQEKKERKTFILFRKLSSAAIAASVLLVAGAFFLGFRTVQGTASESLTETSVESISWYASLGSGESVSTFAAAIDNYYPTGD